MKFQLINCVWCKAEIKIISDFMFDTSERIICISCSKIRDNEKK